ncbi:hypothetical protein [uncultured Agrobacterium sp.]|uniref:hypothetical protein n=1 Tax=uncultured Agrobacterium sp. TaxID=157277 RepID=UPI002587C154|nr:hypothetical protein [uncultured Agrobacterium sp.]
MIFHPRHAAIAELLGTYLTFTPNTRQIEAFHADLRVLHPELLKASIKEALSAVDKVSVETALQRITIHAIYNRKTKELASLYPVIFALENSMRSSLSEFLGNYFGRVDWWVVIRDAHLAGKTYKSFVNVAINGRLTTVDFIKQCFFTMEHLLKSHEACISGPDKNDEFYYCLTIGDLTRLMLTDWSTIRKMFREDRIIGFKLDHYNFKSSMNLIRDARNALYHSNPISNRRAVYAASERILNALDFHLGDLMRILELHSSVGRTTVLGEHVGI